MSYNGIGLNTAKGSGTSGHIQKNLSIAGSGTTKYDRNVNKHDFRKHQELMQQKAEAKLKRKLDYKGDGEILDHELRRLVEVRCFEYQDSIEDEMEQKGSIDENKVKELVKLFKEELLEKIKKDPDHLKKQHCFKRGRVAKDSYRPPRKEKKTGLDPIDSKDSNSKDSNSKDSNSKDSDSKDLDSKDSAIESEYKRAGFTLTFKQNPEAEIEY